MDRNVVSNVATLANRNSGFDYAIRANVGVIADPDLLGNHTVGAHRYIDSDLRRGMNIGGGINTSCATLPIKDDGGLAKSELGLFTQDKRLLVHVATCKLSCNHSRCLRRQRLFK